MRYGLVFISVSTPNLLYVSLSSPFFLDLSGTVLDLEGHKPLYHLFCTYPNEI